jgi:hypothetical protein
MKCPFCKKSLERRKKMREYYTSRCRVKSGDWLDVIVHQRCWNKFKTEDKLISSEYPLLDFFKKIEYN